MRPQEQQAQRVARKVETGHQHGLDKPHDQVERAGHDTPPEQGLRDSATPIEGRTDDDDVEVGTGVAGHPSAANRGVDEI